MIVCYEIINVTKTVSTNVANTILTNVLSTVSIDFDDTKVRYKMNYYISYMFLLVTILLFIVVIIW